MAVYIIIIKAINVIFMSNSDKSVCKGDEEDIINISKTSNIIDILSGSLSPEIEGHKTIKLQK